jgi:hypothetical protein
MSGTKAVLKKALKAARQGDVEALRSMLVEGVAQADGVEEAAAAPAGTPTALVSVHAMLPGEELTLMHEAALSDQVPILELCKSLGGNVDARTRIGRRPLHDAAGAGSHASLRWLLGPGGADVNRPKDNLWSPLMIAAQKGDAEATAVILARVRIHASSVC